MSHEESIDELVTDKERIEFMLRRGWANANAVQRQELTEHWTDARIRMAIDMGLG